MNDYNFDEYNVLNFRDMNDYNFDSGSIKRNMDMIVAISIFIIIFIMFSVYFSKEKKKNGERKNSVGMIIGKSLLAIVLVVMGPLYASSL